MNRIAKRITALLLAVALALPLAACEISSPNGNEILGIQIEEDAPYSTEVLEYAEQTIFSLVSYTYRNAVIDKIPQKVEARLADYAKRIRDITCAKPISEEGYRKAMTCLAEQGNQAVDELIALRNGKGADCELTRTLYLDLAGIFGADALASMLYDCCLLTYDIRYERAEENFETYQYPWYREEADTLKAEKSAFAAGVERSDFSALIRCVTATAEICSLNYGDIPSAFSDAEILEVIRRLDLDKINIDQAGWEILLSHTLSQSTSAYHSALYGVMTAEGDLAKICAVMNDAMQLWINALDKLTAQDVALLREGDREAFISAVFARFDDTDWETFEAITSISLANEKYSEKATEEYAEAYLQYVSGLRAVDLSTLRASVGGEQFYSYLIDYLSGFCPAIAYEVKR